MLVLKSINIERENERDATVDESTDRSDMSKPIMEGGAKMDSLKTYREKRDLLITSEPAGEPSAQAGPIFVVQ